ncbi:hypothetical protein EI42_01680 [Thermosporothrix hazakensis]|jgi:hypothetical protein|uniref:TrbL/VirB6 plasmid conjugal transfer protein n=1 Tax=Thermosporothrix hazakensis TaxID=644383 RepID=A0A326UAC1_THEHA|nr:hypothetical protein [Thermosporothrix hazakensis]PZW32588.1 hypothetical protein EI42_01680 [Thermosporothrix hazakensis]GCE49942.1 hypothetical protein KTH_48110 [Thermosporothrix hazakensis]
MRDLFLIRPRKRSWLSFLDIFITLVALIVLSLLLIVCRPDMMLHAIETLQQRPQSLMQVGAVLAPHACPAELVQAGDCLEQDYKGGGKKIQNPIDDNSALFFYTPYRYTVDNEIVRLLWGAMLAIVDIFLVLVFMMHGLRMMIAGTVFKFSKAIEESPGVLLSLIVVHVSLTFISLFIGLNNVLVNHAYTWANDKLVQTDFRREEWKDLQISANGAAGRDRDTYDKLPQSFKNRCEPDRILYVHDYTQIFKKCPIPGDSMMTNFRLVPEDLNFTNLFDNLQKLGDALPLIIQVLALMLLIQMVIRLFFINLYIVFAPLAIACWALPGRSGQGVTSLWLKGFISTALVQFVMVLALIVTQIMLGAVLQVVATPLKSSGDDGMTGPGGLPVNTLVDLIHVCCLWFIIRIPGLLGTAPMRTMVESGQMMAQVVSTTIVSQFTQAQMVFQAGAGLLPLARFAR